MCSPCAATVHMHTFISVSQVMKEKKRMILNFSFHMHLENY